MVGLGISYVVAPFNTTIYFLKIEKTLLRGVGPDSSLERRNSYHMNGADAS